MNGCRGCFWGLSILIAQLAHLLLRQSGTLDYYLVAGAWRESCHHKLNCASKLINILIFWWVQSTCESSMKPFVRLVEVLETLSYFITYCTPIVATIRSVPYLDRKLDNCSYYVLPSQYPSRDTSSCRPNSTWLSTATRYGSITNALNFIPWRKWRRYICKTFCPHTHIRREAFTVILRDLGH